MSYLNAHTRPIHGRSSGTSRLASLTINTSIANKRRVFIRAAAAAAAATDATYARLIDWCGDGLHTPLVAVAQFQNGGGRGLIAERDAAPGEVLLSVPFDKVFKSKAYDELECHWSAEMALRLLRERAKCHAHDGSGGGSGSGSSSSSSSSSSAWRAWINALPARVVTPLEFSPAEIGAIGIPSTEHEVSAMQAMLREGYDALAPELAALGCGYSDLLWAAQVLFSRCFYEPSLGLHLSVPGVDMANDAGNAANACVRVVHSPDACQGASALEDVAPPMTVAEAHGSGSGSGSAGGGSLFQLVAGDEGVTAGEQVTISYGHRWPAEPYFLLFGFVPAGLGEDDAVVAYNGLDDLARHYCGSSGSGSSGSDNSSSGSSDQLWERVAARAAALITADNGEDDVEDGAGAYDRLIVSVAGLDARLAPAYDLVARAAAEENEGAAAPAPPLNALVAARLREIRARLIDGADVDAGSSSSSSAVMELILAYRAAKRNVVDRALAAMGGGL